jgi:type IV pilus assembly protein PilW
MKQMLANPPSSRRTAQLGFTLIELMVAILIGLFLVGGLLTLVGAMKRTNGTQTNLTQMQDNERLSMSLITDVVQSAGYYPDPHTALGIALPVVTVGTDVFGQQGQSIYGVGSGAAVAPGDTLTVRYVTSGTDGVINCMGGTSAVSATFVNQFSIDGFNNLQCKLTVLNSAGAVVSTTTLPLVNGVQNMQVFYGMKTGTATTLSADTYLDATQVSALTQSATSGWTQVMTVRVTLTMTNLLATLPGGVVVPGQATTIFFTRVIDVMNKTGVRS